ncbi:MAG: hypothetical protein JXQ83_03785 [Candidatus Glassbacteria bacterium]|nr:hypothetical protein [Candidatus Glassbacteria bacterium]
MKKNHLTIIFMKDTNRPLTLEISIRFIILMVAAFVVFSSTYIFFIHGYHTLSQDNKELEVKIRTLKFQISKLESDISKLSQEGSPTISSMGLGGTAIVLKDSVVNKREIDVRDLRLEANPINGKLNFFFVLDNTTDDNHMVRGYVFVVLKDLENQQYYKSYPAIKFKDGIPLSFANGDPYAIKRFKEYRGTLPLEKEADLIEILIYSDIGELLLRIRHEL